ncbi:uncharacterized protein T551_02013 [Pneumocystis jirovecii RU7]|uniref:Uncharacterized protein n=1 Tax=Pneumocystis jirovecii (strain RU7) TaxID=1408657 RepID=A0A0W4ZNX0_PNEJ7|nr:uncharacterized protein T551_02013 [Pneumocystis jirovecii RU7]KTW30069.1 hypothetical protein T551_02013 [Pneumocystis jirovecii RU7]
MQCKQGHFDYVYFKLYGEAGEVLRGGALGIIDRVVGVSGRERSVERLLPSKGLVERDGAAEKGIRGERAAGGDGVCGKGLEVDAWAVDAEEASSDVTVGNVEAGKDADEPVLYLVRGPGGGGGDAEDALEEAGFDDNLTGGAVRQAGSGRAWLGRWTGMRSVVWDEDGRLAAEPSFLAQDLALGVSERLCAVAPEAEGAGA